jgi:tetratricopeptide (TPR) repeat protein
MNSYDVYKVMKNPKLFTLSLTLSLCTQMVLQTTLPCTILTGPAMATTLAEADELLIQGKLRQAEESYRELLGEDESGDVAAGLAVALAKQNTPAKILEAEKILRKAKETHADNPNLMAAAGYVSFVHSKSVASPAKRDLYLTAAENLCSKAIAKNPNIVIAQQTLGLVKYAQDDVEGAIEPLRQAANLADNFVNLTLLAQALLRVDPRDKEAEELVDKALKLKGDYPLAHLQKAIMLTNQGKHEEAFMELHNIPDSARSSEWHAVEGNIYQRQGDGPSAVAAWSKSIAEDPRNPLPYRSKAEFYAMRGDGEMAISEFHNALDILPNDFEMRAALAELALRQDKLDVAESEFKVILQSKPEDPKALLGLARCGFRRYRKDGAYPPEFTQLMDKLQNVVSEQSVQGKVVDGKRSLEEKMALTEATKSLTQGQFRDATSKFLEVIDKHKEDPFELLTLADQCYLEGDYRSAEKAYNYAKDFPEVSTRADQGISKISNQRNEAARHTKLGDATGKIPEVAIDHYNQALAADPQYPPAYFGLFNLYNKSDSAQAIKFGQGFLEVSDDTNPQRKTVESVIAKLKKGSGKN